MMITMILNHQSVIGNYCDVIIASSKHLVQRTLFYGKLVGARPIYLTSFMIGLVVRDIAIGAVGLGFDSLAGQIRHNVAYGLSLL